MNKRSIYPKNWEYLRMVIKVRDNNKCQICGIEGDKVVSKKGKLVGLHCMHLDGNTYNNKYILNGVIFNNSENNLAMGCPTCHKMYDRQNNNQEHVTKKENAIVLDMSNLMYTFHEKYSV